MPDILTLIACASIKSDQVAINMNISDAGTTSRVQDHEFSSFALGPMESITLTSTRRSPLWDGTTTVDVAEQGDGTRITYAAGTAPAFRTNRNFIVDDTTEVEISEVSTTVRRLQHTGGTALDLTSVVVGDWVQFAADTDTITSPFSTQTKGLEFRIVAKGADYIDFIARVPAAAPVIVGADFAYVVKILSDASLVDVGDIFDSRTSDLSIPNQGKFLVTCVSDDYIEIALPSPYPETGVAISSSIIYDRLMGFAAIQSSGAINIAFNDATAPITGDLLDLYGNKAFHLSTTEFFKVDAYNPNGFSVNVDILTGTLQRTLDC